MEKIIIMLKKDKNLESFTQQTVPLSLMNMMKFLRQELQKANQLAMLLKSNYLINCTHF